MTKSKVTPQEASDVLKEFQESEQKVFQEIGVQIGQLLESNGCRLQVQLVIAGTAVTIEPCEFRIMVLRK